MNKLHSSMVWDNISIKEAELVMEDIGIDTPVSLIVWNDEINTFDWVIQSLVEICGHSQ